MRVIYIYTHHRVYLIYNGRLIVYNGHKSTSNYGAPAFRFLHHADLMAWLQQRFLVSLKDFGWAWSLWNLELHAHFTFVGSSFFACQLFAKYRDLFWFETYVFARELPALLG